MCPADEPLNTLSHVELSELAQIVARFEEAWENSPPPTVRDFLPDGSSIRDSVLVQLVERDLRNRYAAGESPRVEEYLPLAGSSAVELQLIAVEYGIRFSHAPDLAREDYTRRFPQFSEELPELLLSKPSQTPEGTRRVQCPDCHNTTLVDDQSVDDMSCPSCGTSIQLDPERTHYQAHAPHRTLGKFELREVVGRGAFGTVYRAFDQELRRVVAVKIPRSGAFGTQEDETRFVREARAAAQLSHPGIVAVHEVGHSHSFPYIVTEYIQGVTLSDALTARRFNDRESAELVAEIAEALAHAHGQGVVHRDLKPSNIMLEYVEPIQGHMETAHPRQATSRSQDAAPRPTGQQRARWKPRIMDFGLARRDEGEKSVTVEGQLLGTPAYMSPEQARGEAHRVDGRSDVYSLGVVFYQMLAGELPFRGNSRMLLQQVLHDAPRPPRKLDAGIDKDLETICLKCMEKEPHRRYSTAQELADDLRRYLAGLPVLARPVGTLGRAWRWYRRYPAAASLTAGGYLVSMSVLLLMWGLLGLLFYSLGFCRTPDPIRPMCEILVFMVGLYLPLLCCGLWTLNGNFYSLIIGTCLLAFASVMTTCTAAGFECSLIGLKSLGEANTNLEVRLHLFSLLALLAVIGLLTHIVALVCHYVKCAASTTFPTHAP